MTLSWRLLRRLSRCGAAGLALLCLSGATAAWAQPRTAPTPRWTFEAVGGGAFGPGPTGGSGVANFPPGSPFTTEAGFPSRAHPSWFFGDGASLFNEVNAQFASAFNVRFPSIVALDVMLTAAGVRRRPGALRGARVTRRLTPRFGIEFGFLRSQGEIQVSEAARQAIEASRASFENAFRGLLGTVPLTALQVTSTADIPGGATAPETCVTGTLLISLVTRGPFAAHASVGAGGVANGGDSLQIRLRGNYQFRFFDLYPISETDTLTVRLTNRDSAVIGVVGGGFTYDVAARQGVRFDLRVHAGRSGHGTLVDASPNIVPSGSVIALPSITNPSVQFSNGSGASSSLAGTTTGLRTFTGGGLDSRVLLTAGYFFRF